MQGNTGHVNGNLLALDQGPGVGLEGAGHLHAVRGDPPGGNGLFLVGNSLVPSMLRKAVFYIAKGGLLQCERWPFTFRFAVF